MGLREKVALVLIAVVFYKTVCSLCVPQPLKENPFEKYLNKGKYGKNRFVTNYKTEPYKKTQRFQDAFNKQNVYKAYSFPEVDLPSGISSKVNSGKTSPIDVLSDSALLNELRKEKRRKRKNKPTEKMYSRDDLPVTTLTESFYNQDPTVSTGLFPEVLYPLTAADTWTTSYWNPLSTKKEADLKTDNLMYQNNKKQKKKNIETFLQPAKMKQNTGIFKVEGNSTKIAQKNMSTVKENIINNTISSENLGHISEQTIENNKTKSQNQSKKLEDTKVLSKDAVTTTLPFTTKKKHKALKKIISEASRKDPNFSKKVLSESIASRSRPRQNSKVTQSNNKTNNICSSTTSCINSKKVNAMNLTYMEDPNVQIVELLKDDEPKLVELKNNVPDKLVEVNYNDKPNDGATLPIMAAKTSNIALEDLKGNWDVIPEIASDDLVKDPPDDFTIQVKSKDSKENNSEVIRDSTLNDTVLNDHTADKKPNIDSIKLHLQSADIATETPIESYPAYPTSSLKSLQSNEDYDYPVSVNDDALRQQILDVLSTEKLSISSLRENILKILLTEEKNPSGFVLEAKLTDNPENKENSKSLSIENPPSENILDFSVTLSPSVELIDNPSNGVEELLAISLSSEPILEFPKTAADSAEIISKFAVIDTNITPEENETILDDIEITSTASENVTEAFANNLREIVSKPSNSKALVDDLREIIRLLTIWNSQIDDSEEVLKTSEKPTNPHNWNITDDPPTSEIIVYSSDKNKLTQDSAKLITDSSSHFENSDIDSNKIVTNVKENEYDGFNERPTIIPNKNIPNSTFNDKEKLSADPESNLSVTFNLDNKTLSEMPSDVNEFSEIFRDLYNTASVEQLKSESNEVAHESTSNDDKDTLAVKLEPLDNNNHKLAETPTIALCKASPDLSDSESPIEESTADCAGITTDNLLNDNNTDNSMPDSKVITTNLTDEDTIAKTFSAIPTDVTIFEKITNYNNENNQVPVINSITDKLFKKDTKIVVENSSGSVINESMIVDPNVDNKMLADALIDAHFVNVNSKNNAVPELGGNSLLENNTDVIDKVIQAIELDKALSDDLGKQQSDDVSSAILPAAFSSDNRLSTLTKKTVSHFPMSFISTYMPKLTAILVSIQKESEKHSSPINFVAKKHDLPVDENSVVDVCPIIDENSFKNQCYIFEEPDDFNLTSNHRNIVSDKPLLTSVDGPSDTLSDDKQQYNITLTDLIMGYDFLSNHITESYTSILVADGEIPDFSDYASSPEDDTRSDFFDNTLFNINETYQDQLAYALLSEKADSEKVDTVFNDAYMLLNDKSNDTSINKLRDETDNGAPDEFKDASHIETTHEFIEYGTIPYGFVDDVSNETLDEILQNETDIDKFDLPEVYNFSDKSTVITHVIEFDDDSGPDNLDTGNETDTKIKTVSKNYSTGNLIDNINATDMLQNEFDTYMSNESDLSTDKLLPYEQDTDMFSESIDKTLRKSGVETSFKLKKYEPLPDSVPVNVSAAKIEPETQSKTQFILHESFTDTISVMNSTGAAMDMEKNNDVVINLSNITSVVQEETFDETTLFTYNNTFQNNGKIAQSSNNFTSGESNAYKSNELADVKISHQSEVDASYQTDAKNTSMETFVTESDHPIVDVILDIFSSSEDSEPLTDKTPEQSTSDSAKILFDKLKIKELSKDSFSERTSNADNESTIDIVKASTDLASHKLETDQTLYKPADSMAVDVRSFTESVKEFTDDTISEPNESVNNQRLRSSEENKTLIDKTHIDNTSDDGAKIVFDEPDTQGLPEESFTEITSDTRNADNESPEDIVKAFTDLVSHESETEQSINKPTDTDSAREFINNISTPNTSVNPPRLNYSIVDGILEHIDSYLFLIDRPNIDNAEQTNDTDSNQDSQRTR